MVRCAIQRPPEGQRGIIKLHDVLDVRMREIGSALGVSQGRASQIRQLALARVRLELHCIGIRSAAAAY